MSEYTNDIINAANQYGIDPNVLLAVAARETGGDDINAIQMVNNDIGAQGMMQIMPDTASNYGVDQLYPNWATDPAQNALAGAYILKKKIEEQGGDLWQGVRAYNGAGEAANQYMAQVQANYNKLGGASKGQPFTYQAKDTDDIPFIDLTAYLRTDRPDEKLDSRGLMEMMRMSDIVGKNKLAMDNELTPDYGLEMSGYSGEKQGLLSPIAEKLQSYKTGYDDAINEQNGFLGKLGTGAKAVNLINNSESTSNRGIYAALAKQLGVDVNPGTDQFVGGGDLLDFRQKQEASDRQYNETVRQMKQAQDNFERKLAFQRESNDKLHAVKLSGVLAGLGGANG